MNRQLPTVPFLAINGEFDAPQPNMIVVCTAIKGETATIEYVDFDKQGKWKRPFKVPASVLTPVADFGVRVTAIGNNDTIQCSLERESVAQ